MMNHLTVHNELEVPKHLSGHNELKRMTTPSGQECANVLNNT
jgi:hypothetical protein